MPKNTTHTTWEERFDKLFNRPLVFEVPEEQAWETQTRNLQLKNFIEKELSTQQARLKERIERLKYEECNDEACLEEYSRNAALDEVLQLLEEDSVERGEEQ